MHAIDMSNFSSIAIIGGGFSGCLTAILLAKLGYKVTIIEFKSELFLGASNRTWFRFHMGPHYPTDLKTAQGMQQASVLAGYFLRDFLMEIPPPEYYIHSAAEMQQTFPGTDNRLTPERFIQVLEKQRANYAQLLLQYPEAEEVFGPKEDYYKLIDPRSENYMRECTLGITSNERLLNLPKLIGSTLAAVNGNPNISILTATEAVDADYDFSEKCFILTLKDINTGEIKKRQFSQLVQAGWGKGIELDHKILNNVRSQKGLEKLLPSTTHGDNFHRLRGFALVKGVKADRLTHKLLLSTQAASYGYIADGVGVLEANGFNTADSSMGLRPDKWDSILFGKSEIADKIGFYTFEHCKKYFPFLEGAEYDGPITGDVISEVDIRKRSAEVLRNTGLQQLGVYGYHSASAMKLTNIPLAAFSVLQAVIAQNGDDFGFKMSLSPERFMQSLIRSVALPVASPEAMQQVVAGRENFNTIEGLALREAK